MSGLYAALPAPPPGTPPESLLTRDAVLARLRSKRETAARILAASAVRALEHGKGGPGSGGGGSSGGGYEQTVRGGGGGGGGNIGVRPTAAASGFDRWDPRGLLFRGEHDDEVDLDGFARDDVQSAT